MGSNHPDRDRLFRRQKIEDSPKINQACKLLKKQEIYLCHKPNSYISYKPTLFVVDISFGRHSPCPSGLLSCCTGRRVGDDVHLEAAATRRS